MDDILAFPVRYMPHAEHRHLADHPMLAAIVGRVHDDGTADLMVLVPNKEPHWQDKVPQGTGPHTWHHVHEGSTLLDDELIPTGTVAATGDIGSGAIGASDTGASDTGAAPAA